MLTVGCTMDGTAGISLTRGSQMGPVGTPCPKVRKTSGEGKLKENARDKRKDHAEGYS